MHRTTLPSTGEEGGPFVNHQLFVCGSVWKFDKNVSK